MHQICLAYLGSWFLSAPVLILLCSLQSHLSHLAFRDQHDPLDLFFMVIFEGF